MNVSKAILEKSFIGLIFFVNALYIAKCFDVPIGTTTNPGPGYLPLVIGLLGMLISGYLFLTKLRLNCNEKIAEFDRSGILRFVWYIVTLLLFALLFVYLGPLAVGLLFFSLAKASGFPGKWRPFLVSAVLAIALYVVFINVLFVPLPMGIF